MADQTLPLNVSYEMKADDERQNCVGMEIDEELCSSSSDSAEELYSSSTTDACGDGLPSVPKTAVNQRFLRFGQKKRCVFLFPQSGYEGTDLPQGIGFGERKIYILAKGYFFAKVNL